MSHRLPSLRSLRGAPWLLTLSYADALRAAVHRTVTRDQWDAWLWLWTWHPTADGAAARVTRAAFLTRHGPAALARRVARVGRYVAALQAIDDLDAPEDAP
jgi:hypothetical protein